MFWHGPKQKKKAEEGEGDSVREHKLQGSLSQHGAIDFVCWCCIFSIYLLSPYAPIPSASSFGVGFGCLNTFSWGYLEHWGSLFFLHAIVFFRGKNQATENHIFSLLKKPCSLPREKKRPSYWREKNVHCTQNTPSKLNGLDTKSPHSWKKHLFFQSISFFFGFMLVFGEVSLLTSGFIQIKSCIPAPSKGWRKWFLLTGVNSPSLRV